MSIDSPNTKKVFNKYVKFEKQWTGTNNIFMSLRRTYPYVQVICSYR